MPAFNVIQKERRAKIQDKKRAAHGDPVTRKLKQRAPLTSLSGKRKRKIFRKWRREQKEAIEKGLVSMEDVEMAVAEGTSKEVNDKPQKKFHFKKASKMKIKKLKSKGKKKTTKPSTESSADVMVE